MDATNKESELMEYIINELVQIDSEKLKVIVAKSFIIMLKNDKGYRQAVMANIAMNFIDAWHNEGGLSMTMGSMGKLDYDELHNIANKAAKNFIDILTETKNEYFD